MRSEHCIRLLIILLVAGFLTACSTSKNTSGSRFFHAFTARYNTGYNASVAFEEGVEAQEKGHKDNYTELLPMFIVADKKTAALGKSHFETAIEKSEKAIKRHSIKRKPKKPSGRMTPKEKAFFQQREFNPYLKKSWMMFADAQFRQGNFIEAASSYNYIMRLYQGQPDIYGVARAKLARCYVLMDWPYDAEDVLTKMRRDTLTQRGQRERDISQAAHLIATGQLKQAIKPLTTAVKYAGSSLQKARLYYLLGQVYQQTGQSREAYKALGKCIGKNPPYELAFNARILQTEVMAHGQGRAMIRKLQRMLKNPNNEDYQDRIYYAIGNIHLASRDTLRCTYAWKKGIEESTQNGFAKAILCQRLGELYWKQRNYIDATECYAELVGLIDKERKDYNEINRRSKALTETEPHLSAVKLQDSLQVLAKLPEKQYLAVIDRVISDLKKKEKEQEKKEHARQGRPVSAGAAAARTGATGGRTTAASARTGQQKGTFYFYSPMVVNQGKQDFLKKWGKRPNEDNWRRSNKTTTDDAFGTDMAGADSLGALTDSLGVEGELSAEEQALKDSLENDPHQREYYLKQLPLTPEKLEESNLIIQDGLHQGGVALMEKIEDFDLAYRTLIRLVNRFPEYDKMDDVYYHLFLLAFRRGNTDEIEYYRSLLQSYYPESEVTKTISHPRFVELAQNGRHLEDTLYAETYDAYKNGLYYLVEQNFATSTEDFAEGPHRPQFLFIHAMTQLYTGHRDKFLEELRELISKFGSSEVSKMADYIVKGLEEGRLLRSDKYEVGSLWARHSLLAAGSDSTAVADTLVADPAVPYVFVLAYPIGSVDEDRLLFEMARYNFTSFMTRNFDMEFVSAEGITQLRVTGFQSYDEVHAYAQQLYTDAHMNELLEGLRAILISESNLKLLGTRYSYDEYAEFFDVELSTIELPEELHLDEPTDLEPIDPEDLPVGGDSSEEGEEGEESTGGNDDEDWLY